MTHRRTMTSADLKAYREKYKLTQERLAELLDTSVFAVRAWEQGRRPISTITAFALRYLMIGSTNKRAGKTNH